MILRHASLTLEVSISTIRAI